MRKIYLVPIGALLIVSALSPAYAVVYGDDDRKEYYQGTTVEKAAADAVTDLAADMLQIQATRTSRPGIRFATDTAWQHEFEHSFPFHETPDQLSAELDSEDLGEVDTEETEPDELDDTPTEGMDVAADADDEAPDAPESEP